MIHKELDIKKDFDLKFIKIKKDTPSLFEMLGSMEESVQDITHKLKMDAVPLFLHR